MSLTFQPSDSAKGIFAMIAATLLLTLNDTLSKWLTETYSIWQVICVRQAFSLVAIAAYVRFVAGAGSLRVTNRAGVALRAAFFAITTALIVTSFSLLPLAVVTAIAFASPLFVLTLSHLFTSENIGIRRWLAVLAGFTGVLVIVRPGGPGFEWILLFPLVASLTSSIRDVVTRGISRTESSISILLWSNVATIAVAGAAILFYGWQSMSGPVVMLLAFNGFLHAGAHFLMIESLRLGEASLVSPFRYSGLIWAILLGFLVWGDFPDSWTLVGAAVLVLSGIYIIERNPKAVGQEGR